MALDRDKELLKKITKFPSKKQWDDLAYSWLKERFPNAEDVMIREAKFNQEVFHVVAYIDWKKVRVRVDNSNMATVLEDGFNILISDREVLIHLIQK